MHEWLFKTALAAYTFTGPYMQYIFIFLVVLTILGGIFDKLKPITGNVLILGGYAIGLHYWLAACVYSLGTFSLLLFVIAMLLLGLGVFPLGVAALLIHKDWSIAGLMVLGLVFAWGFRFLGMRYIYQYAKKTSEE